MTDIEALAKSDTRTVYAIYADEKFGALTPMVGDTLADMEETYGESEVKFALLSASYHEKRSLNYAEAICRKRAGQTTRREIFANQQREIEADQFDAENAEYVSGLPAQAAPSKTPYDTWSDAYAQMKLEFPKESFHWLATSRYIGFENDVFTIGVASLYAQDWLEKRMKPAILLRLRYYAGPDVDIRFVDGSINAPDIDLRT